MGAHQLPSRKRDHTTCTTHIPTPHYMHNPHSNSILHAQPTFQLHTTCTTHIPTPHYMHNPHSNSTLHAQPTFQLHTTCTAHIPTPYKLNTFETDRKHTFPSLLL